jgi:PAS domain S-box-containing protein
MEAQIFDKDELQFQGLLESAPDAMVITNGEGKIIMVNAQTERIFGWGRHELAGKKVEILIPERFRSKHVYHREGYVENPKVRGMGVDMELFGKRKDGSEFPVEISLSPMKVSEDELVTISAIRDITKQKETEAEIKKINNNLEKIVSERTQKLENALKNEQALRDELIHEQNRLRILTGISEAFALTSEITNTLDAATNKIIPEITDWYIIDQIENDGSFSFLAGSHIASEKIPYLRELKNKFPPDPTFPKGIYHAIQTKQPSLLPVITDDMLSTIIKSPEQWELIKAIGIKSVIIIPLLVRNQVFGIFTLGISSSGRTFTRKDLEFAVEFGRRISLAMENSSLYKEMQEMNAELEQRVTRRTLELEATNKELEAFSYSVSHDLRAPLRSIDGFSNKILKDYSANFDAQAKDYFARIMNASKKMGVLIDDLLKLARLTRVEMKMEVTNLTEMATSIINELKELNPERNVSFYVQEGMIQVADRNLLQIALQNLIGNAWKYSRNQSLATIELGSFVKEELTTYFIKDNGVGFDMRYVDKLFGAFQRLHAITEFEGTGIGLATVQRIIRRHHGNIWAESEINKGTTFYFTLN